MKFALGVALAILASALVVSYVPESGANSLSQGGSCARDYMVRLVGDKVISKSTLVRHFIESMNIVKQRFDKAKLNHELDGKDAQERENFYYKIALEEMRNLKARIESGSIIEQGASIDAEIQKSVGGCIDPVAVVKNWDPKTASMDEDDEMDLLHELEDIEEIARSDENMEWPLSGKSRAALKSRTKQVLTDLINNELRQIGMAVLSAYLSNGSIVLALLPLSGPIKYKLADFFMSKIVDQVSYAMGRKV